MRIRKNAKLSQLSTISSASPCSNSLTKTHLNCQLNQSPWDIITFPLPNSSDHFQVDEHFWFAGNGSFGDSIGAIHSPLESEEVLNNDKVYDFLRSDDSRVGFDELVKEERIIVKEEEKEEDVVLCCETDGKGWQCGRIVKKNGHTHKMCAIHLKSCNGTQKRGRGRPPSKKKKPAPAPGGADENPNEYYYYSGFGPLWGKKKGPGRKSNDDVTMSKTEGGDTKITVPEIDYMECDDDDDDEEADGGEIGKKRGRKKIKARSLKSLM